MQNYYLNKDQQPSGDFEVHTQSCAHGALPVNQIPLGAFNGCSGAVAEAKRRFPDHASQINGCYWCCNACNTG